MADDRRYDQGLDLPRTDGDRPEGAISGGGIGGAHMDVSGAGADAATLRAPSSAGSGGMAGAQTGGMAAGSTGGAYAQAPLSSGALAADARSPLAGDARGGSAARDGDISDNRLIAADRVTGTAVYDNDGDRMGVIDNLMIDKITGEVAYAVMSFGGFLGIGERYHPLPWDVLSYDTKLGGYNVGMAAANLKDAPNYDREELSTFGDRDYGSRVDDYYSTRRSQQGGLSGMTRTSAD